jgi:hypothetical protein
MSLPSETSSPQAAQMTRRRGGPGRSNCSIAEPARLTVNNSSGVMARYASL